MISASARSQSRELIEQNMDRIVMKSQVAADESLLYRSDTSNLSQHNEQYTALLRAYVKDFEENSKRKRTNKQELFQIAKCLLICIPIFTFVFICITLCFLAYDRIDVLESLPGLTAALASLLGTFMIIPKMITRYLYNKKEEEHLAEIISRIQDYDKNIRGELK